MKQRKWKKEEEVKRKRVGREKRKERESGSGYKTAERGLSLTTNDTHSKNSSNSNSLLFFILLFRAPSFLPFPSCYARWGVLYSLLNARHEIRIVCWHWVHPNLVYILSLVSLFSICIQSQLRFLYLYHQPLLLFFDINTPYYSPSYSLADAQPPSRPNHNTASPLRNHSLDSNTELGQSPA